MIPALWSSRRKTGDPLLSNLYHTPFRFYIRVAEPTDQNPTPPIRIGLQNIVGYLNNGTQDFFTNANIELFRGDPNLIDSNLFHTISDTGGNGINLRRYSRSSTPDLNIHNYNLSNFRNVFPSRKSAVAAYNSNNTCQFLRYSDNRIFIYNTDPLFPRNSWNQNAVANGIVFNTGNASGSYNRFISTSIWSYAAASGGDRNRIIGFKGRSINDTDEALDEVPLWININGDIPIGQCASISGISVLSEDHCVMQASYIESIPNPNPSTRTALNPFRLGIAASTDLYSVRVYRIDLINGEANYTLIGRFIRRWTVIDGTGEGNFDSRGNPIPEYREPTTIDEGGSIISSMTETNSGELIESVPYDVNNINTSPTHSWLMYINESLIIGSTRRFTSSGVNVLEYSRDKGQSWLPLNNSVISQSAGISSYSFRGSYCVRKDLSIRKDRFQEILDREIEFQ